CRVTAVTTPRHHRRTGRKCMMRHAHSRYAGGGTMATLKVVPMTLREANDFVEQYHRHNGRTARNGGKFAIGATTGDRLVGVAIVGRPLARHLDDSYTAEVLRVCVLPDAPKGTCSFLYARCWRIWAAMGGTRLVT